MLLECYTPMPISFAFFSAPSAATLAASRDSMGTCLVAIFRNTNDYKICTRRVLWRQRAIDLYISKYEVENLAPALEVMELELHDITEDQPEHRNIISRASSFMSSVKSIAFFVRLILYTIGYDTR